jgi:hypothetical protein
VSGLPRVRFPCPPAEPDVRLSPHPALHVPYPSLHRGGRWAVQGRDDGPRRWWRHHHGRRARNQRAEHRSARPTRQVAPASDVSWPGRLSHSAPASTPVFTDGFARCSPLPEPTRCRPSPCSRLWSDLGVLRRLRPTRPFGRHRTYPPAPHLASASWWNVNGRFPPFTAVRSTREASSCTPAASPWLRRRPSPWPPDRTRLHRPEVPPHTTVCGVRAAHQPTSTGLELARSQEASDTGFSRIPSRLAHRARPIR